MLLSQVRLDKHCLPLLGDLLLFELLLQVLTDLLRFSYMACCNFVLTIERFKLVDVQMRFNSINKPSFAVFLSFGVVKVNKDACGYAFRVGQVLNLIPAFARASVRSFYAFVLCECSDERSIFTFQKHS